MTARGVIEPARAAHGQKMVHTRRPPAAWRRVPGKFLLGLAAAVAAPVLLFALVVLVARLKAP